MVFLGKYAFILATTRKDRKKITACSPLVAIKLEAKVKLLIFRSKKRAACGLGTPMFTGIIDSNKIQFWQRTTLFYEGY